MGTDQYGGQSSNEFGTNLTVEPPAGTDADHPLLAGTVWKLAGLAKDGSGYKLAQAEEGDSFNEEVLGIVTERRADLGPVGFKLLNSIQQVAIVPIEAPYPEIGKSVEIGASGSAFRVHLDPISGLPSYDGITFCVRVDAAMTMTAEVLI